MKTLLLIDFNNVMFQSIAVHSEFTHEDAFTGGVYGFLIQIAKLTSNFSPENIIVCLDHPPYHRKLRYPMYKEDRKKQKNPDPDFGVKLQTSKNQIKNLCAVLGIPIWSEEGQEADDLIAHAAINLHKDYDKIIVRSNDEDLKQMLIYDNFFFFRNKAVYGKKDFLVEHPECTPEMWLLVESLTGTHNGIPGLNRVGAKTAIKILNDKNKFNKVYAENGEMLDRNMELIELPCPFAPVTSEIPLKPFSFVERDLIRFLATLGIDYASYIREAFAENC